jgi:lysophospholipase L1-like esterase
MNSSKSVCSFLAIAAIFGNCSSLHASQLTDNLRSGKDQVVVGYGTSLTEKSVWPERLETWLNSQGFSGKAKVLNKGVSGSTTASHGIKDFDRDVVEQKPDTIIIEFGMNDCIRRLADPSATPPRLEDQPQPAVPLEQFRKNLVTMVDRLRKELPATEVFLMTMNPAFDSTSTPNSGKYRGALPVYYAAMNEIAAEKSVKFIDIYPQWLEALKKDAEARGKFIPDGVHPKPAGVDAVTMPAIQEALAK